MTSVTVKSSFRKTVEDKVHVGVTGLVNAGSPTPAPSVRSAQALQSVWSQTVTPTETVPTAFWILLTMLQTT